MNEYQTVIVERRFKEQASFAALQAAEDAVGWCLEQHRVTFRHSYVSLDGRKMVCFYSAPDAEAVRETQRRGELPVECVWSAQVLGDTGRRAAEPGRSTVLVERAFAEPVPPAMFEALLASGEGCLRTNQVNFLFTNLSFDRMRMICVYQAPDAEAVRRANRQLGVPVSSVWTASFHGPLGLQVTRSDDR
ncbi:MAG TPA: nickel-binding protein [Labilithrix sp.]|nr:nickel-binding protein [Labilithrix sp.]